MLSADDLFKQIDEAYLKVLDGLQFADAPPGGVGVAPGAAGSTDKPDGGNGNATTGDLEYHGPQAVQCLVCDMWLNGPTQFEDHKIGKKHKKNLRKPQGGHGITKLDPPEVVEVAERCTPLALGSQQHQDDSGTAYGIDQGQWQADGQWAAEAVWPAVGQWLAEGQWLPGQWLAEEQPPQPPHDYHAWRPGIWQLHWMADSWQHSSAWGSWQDDSWQWKDW